MRFLCLALVSAAAISEGTAQQTHVAPVANVALSERGTANRNPARFHSRGDSLEAERARRLAEGASGYRVVVSLEDRTLWVLYDNDTLRTATVAVASGLTLDFAGRTWTFRTPRGKHAVMDAKVDPTWVPPDWMYAEAALEHDLRLSPMRAGKPVRLKDGRLLTVQDSVVGVADRTGTFSPLPLDEHIVFDSTLFIPPFGSKNRQVGGELGAYALDLGDGYLLHGTPYLDSLGNAATHGCIRLGDEDIEWLYRHVGRGTPVYIY